ncbi:hypothetical protein [Streptomyces cadmiisoli]|uniref:Transferase n=1 Tax=Streptomyces cadmiisoli TaxID=2184053 RepID=A0A2Z4J2R9_9ACTN|nr:hypothetical protein [Streptomyces cadmiisoli]AWW39307.1 hypothetical protein DN051_23785 [Streptomyces cadmiisoli]
MNGNPYFLRDRELSPRGAQSRTRGRTLLVTGWALRLLGSALGVAALVIFRAVFNADRLPDGLTQPWWWLALLGSFALLYAAAFVFGAGRGLVVRGKRDTADLVEGFGQLTGTRYVLYLRPFSQDEDMARLPDDVTGGGGNEYFFLVSGLTHEEALVRRFRKLGRVIAIGMPGEPLPLPGAERAYLPLDDWKDTVSGLIGGAYVVLLSAGPGPGTVWEFTEAVRLLPPERLVLLTYCDPAAYDRFRAAVKEEYARRSRSEPGAPDTGHWPPLPELPDFPSPARPVRPRWEVWLNGGRKRLRWDFALKGLIVFSPRWDASFIRFDPTSLRLPSVVTPGRLVRRMLGPVMERLAALPDRS